MEPDTATTERLRFHFEPERGWMNDPNGLCFFRGLHHAFFQHYPDAPHWGPMHWGHAVSEDLIHWRELPIALRPDQPYENGGGCWSGSAVEKDGRLHLFYTSTSKGHAQAQSLAISDDGIRFVKHPGNPVVPVSPVDPSNHDFRDPKVFPYGDEWRMVCGAGKDGLASVLLFRSADLVHWEYLGPVFQSREMGAVPECPDLFPLDGRWVLLFSRMDGARRVQFIVGTFDGEHFKPETFVQPETGPDFYAAQTYADAPGRRLCIGWMWHWGREAAPGAVRAGALTLPRELSLDADGTLYMRPIHEAANLLVPDADCLRRENGTVAVMDGGRILLEVPEREAGEPQVLVDGPAREVFLGDGCWCCTFWTGA